MADHEETFEGTSSGASDTIPQQCSALRKNHYVVIKSRPCKIVEMSTSKTGKHGHAKIHMVGIDVFTGKKYEDICPSTHNMNCPIVGRQEYTLMAIDNDGYLSLMDENGTIREDLKAPTGDTDLARDIATALEGNAGHLVTVLKAMGTEQVISIKMDNKS